MEGISQEAISLAGHLKLNKLLFSLMIIIFQLMGRQTLLVLTIKKDLKHLIGIHLSQWL